MRSASASEKPNNRQPARMRSGSPAEKIRIATAMKPRPDDMFSVNMVV